VRNLAGARRRLESAFQPHNRHRTGRQEGIDEVRDVLQLRKTWVLHRRTTHRVVCCRHVLDV